MNDLEKFYLGRPDQEIVNLANGFAHRLDTEGKPESAAVVRELVRRFEEYRPRRA